MIYLLIQTLLSLTLVTKKIQNIVVKTHFQGPVFQEIIRDISLTASRKKFLLNSEILCLL